MSRINLLSFTTMEKVSEPKLKGLFSFVTTEQNQGALHILPRKKFSRKQMLACWHISFVVKCILISKANWLHPCNYLHKPTDYRHTDNHVRLIMVVVALCCTWQSWAPKTVHMWKCMDRQMDATKCITFLLCLALWPIKISVCLSVSCLWHHMISQCHVMWHLLCKKTDQEDWPVDQAISLFLLSSKQCKP